MLQALTIFFKKTVKKIFHRKPPVFLTVGIAGLGDLDLDGGDLVVGRAAGARRKHNLNKQRLNITLTNNTFKHNLNKQHV